MNRDSPISNTVLRTITNPKNLQQRPSSGHCQQQHWWVTEWLWESCTQKCLPVQKPNNCVQTVSKVEWEMSFSWSLRVTTDVILSGEAKMDNLTQQQLGVKAKSQCFQESPAPKSIELPTSTILEEEVHSDPPRCFHFFWLKRPLFRVKLGGTVLGIMRVHQK